MIFYFEYKIVRFDININFLYVYWFSFFIYFIIRGYNFSIVLFYSFIILLKLIIIFLMFLD